MRKAWTLLVIAAAGALAATSVAAQPPPDPGKKAPAVKEAPQEAPKKDTPPPAMAQPKKETPPPAAEAKKDVPATTKAATPKSKRMAKTKPGRHARGHRRHRHAHHHRRHDPERGIWVYRAHARHSQGYVYVRRELGGYFARGRCEGRRANHWRH